MKQLIGLLITILSIVPPCSDAAVADACNTLLPSSLKQIVLKQFPTYRVVREADYEPKTISSELEYRRGNRCIGISTGDFDGNGERDYAFLMVGPKALVLLAGRKSSGDKWIVDKLWMLKEGHVGSTYVNTLPPDRYEQVYGAAGEPGELLMYESKRDGVVSGTIQSSGKAFFYDGSKWVFLWISD